MEEILIFGDGDQSRIVQEIVQLEKKFKVAKVVGKGDDFASYNIFRGIVAIGDNYIRECVVKDILEKLPNFEFVSVVHPRAILSDNNGLRGGSMVMAGAIVNCGAVIGEHVIINTGAVIEHDCILNDYVSVGPGATLGGKAKVGKSSVVGLGASVIHGVEIGEETVVGAGSVVVKNLSSFSVCHGVPSKKIRERKIGEKYL